LDGFNLEDALKKVRTRRTSFRDRPCARAGRGVMD
jgi:hypothetical protein